MEAMECLRSRRSVRKYKPDTIPDEVLEEVLDAAIHAPSAINLQHWYFVALKSPEKMVEYRELMCRVRDKFRPVLEDRFKKNPQAIKDTETFHTHLGHAPVCVLAFLLKSDFPDRDGAVQSTSAAMENLLLAAWAKGLGSCWMTSAQRMGFGEEIRQKFAPDKGEFVGAITLGYPEEVGKMPPRRESRYDII